MTDIGQLRVSGMAWDSKIEVDKKDKTSTQGEILRVKADDPEAQQKLAEAAKNHKGTEIVAQDGEDLVLYASDKDFKAADVAQIKGSTVTNVDGMSIKSPQGKSLPVVSMFTDDNKELGLKQSDFAAGISVLRDLGEAGGSQKLDEGTRRTVIDSALAKPSVFHWSIKN